MGRQVEEFGLFSLAHVALDVGEGRVRAFPLSLSLVYAAVTLIGLV